MKNQAILITHQNDKAIVSNVDEALSFVRSLHTEVEGRMLETFIENFNLFLKGEKVNSSGADVHAFAIGGNSKNPRLFLRNVTGLSADKDLKKAANEIVEKALKDNAKTDLKLSIELGDDYYKITGGSCWFWSKTTNSHYPVHEVFIKGKDLNVNAVSNSITKRINA